MKISQRILDKKFMQLAFNKAFEHLGSTKENPSVAYVNESILHKIVISEAGKVYHTKNVDSENSKGFYSSYKKLVSTTSSVILEICPEFKYSNSLATNLFEMSKLKVPIISVVIGEGASGGALGIGVCDKMLMMQNTWYSVISPEGCASILFRDAKKAEEAAEALKPIPSDLLKVGICERIIDEPNGGAHRDFESSAISLKIAIIEELEKLSRVDSSEFLDRRIQKYHSLGYFND